jgi:hypothetical protein
MNTNHAQGELLAQIKPAVTTAVELFATQELRVEVTLIITVNRNASPVLVQIFHDDDGSTYDTTTEILRTDEAANASDIMFQAQHAGSGIMLVPGATLGAQIETANDVTISVYGHTETLAERVRGLT